ncbi:MAG: hypothetical protein B6D39_06520 [Anaerolineae bacterium UTCFX2]|jgi:hypothetical protein|nr:DUF2917 domain-containing protein [Anaerolineales bacterium]OQY91601.1 MAG: hypothetical protein B6D39_06520 [Anaerolineae bacterium UTCFX2]
MTTQVTKINPAVTQNRETRTAERKFLQKGILKSLSHIRSGDGVVCTSGILWITQQNDSDDHILYPGDKFTAKHGGRVVLQSMSDKATWDFSNN